jgi:hypothetical protein
MVRVQRPRNIAALDNTATTILDYIENLPAN